MCQAVQRLHGVSATILTTDTRHATGRCSVRRCHGVSFAKKQTVDQSCASLDIDTATHALGNSQDLMGKGGVLTRLIEQLTQST